MFNRFCFLLFNNNNKKRFDTRLLKVYLISFICLTINGSFPHTHRFFFITFNFKLSAWFKILLQGNLIYSVTN